jgi:hypothetical protein
MQLPIKVGVMCIFALLGTARLVGITLKSSMNLRLFGTEGDAKETMANATMLHAMANAKNPPPLFQTKGDANETMANATMLHQSSGPRRIETIVHSQNSAVTGFFSQTCLFDRTGTATWNSRILQLENVAVTLVKAGILRVCIAGTDAEAKDMEKQIAMCKPSFFKCGNQPGEGGGCNIEVRTSQHCATCSAGWNSNSPLLVGDTWLNGAYYHTVLDTILPMFFSARLMHTKFGKWPIISSMHNIEGAHAPPGRAIENIGNIIESLNLKGGIGKNGSVPSDCFRHVWIGFHFEWRPAHMCKNGDCSDMTIKPPFIPALQGPIREFSTIMRQFYGISPESHTSNVKNRVLLSIRKGSGSRMLTAKNVQEIEAVFHSQSFAFDKVAFEDMSLSQVVHVVSQVNLMAGIEGAGFVNQIFLPIEATILVIHVPREGPPLGARHWHSAVSQYLGHSVLDWILVDNFVPALEFLTVVKFCRSHVNHSGPFHCNKHLHSDILCPAALG